MGIFSKFERKMEDTVEGAADKMVGAPLSPVQIAKKAEKQMRREKMVGAGKQYAPTLYTVLVNADDDERLFGYYPTLAGETETYLAAKAAESGLVMDGQPLVRFIVDDELKHGKFEVIAEMVAGPLVSQLRQEEMERYGIASPRPARASAPNAAGAGAGFADAGFAGAASTAGGAGMAAAAQAFSDEREDGAAQPQTMAFNRTPANSNMAAPTPIAFGASPTAYLYDAASDKAFTLTNPHMGIGRESGNHITIPDINVSRYHAEIRQEVDGTWILSDLGSTNGTFVNGRRIKSTPLNDADMIVMGTTTLEFQLI